MHHYTIWQWVLIFYIYAFLGWVFESCYVSLKKRKWVNRGFLKGPMLPIYASGAVVMLVVSIPLQGNLVVTYFAGMIAATALEYVVGVAMEALFKVKYWDYSNQKFNFQGIICLSSSIAWGFFTILMTNVIHRPVDWLVMSMPTWALYTIDGIISVNFVADSIVSVKAALDLRFLLEKLTVLHQDLEELQEQLAEAKENTKLRLEEMSERSKEKAEEWKERLEGLQEKFAFSEESLKDMQEKSPEMYRIYNKYREKRAEYGKLLSKTGKGFRKQLLRNNPGASSKHFRSALADAKRHIWKRKKESNGENVEN